MDGWMGEKGHIPCLIKTVNVHCSRKPSSTFIAFSSGLTRDREKEPRASKSKNGSEKERNSLSCQTSGPLRPHRDGLKLEPFIPSHFNSSCKSGMQRPEATVWKGPGPNRPFSSPKK